MDQQHNAMVKHWTVSKCKLSTSDGNSRPQPKSPLINRFILNAWPTVNHLDQLIDISQDVDRSRDEAAGLLCAHGVLLCCIETYAAYLFSML